MRRRFSTALIAMSALVLATLLAAPVSAQNPGGSAEGKSMKNPVPSSPESIKAGQALFQKDCRFCHNADAKGNRPMAPEGQHSTSLTADNRDTRATYSSYSHST